jgi:hypothetical protein
MQRKLKINARAQQDKKRKKKKTNKETQGRQGQSKAHTGKEQKQSEEITM